MDAAELTLADWERAGLMLQRQRVVLDRRYVNRKLFCAERGLDYRLSWDVEHAVRDNYLPPTLARVALGYGLQPGDIEAMLRGDVVMPPAPLTPAPAAGASFAPADRRPVVVFLTGQGWKHAQIAGALGVSLRTVEADLRAWRLGARRTRTLGCGDTAG